MWMGKYESMYTNPYFLKKTKSQSQYLSVIFDNAAQV